MLVSNASAFYAAIGQEPPSMVASYLLTAFPWLFLSLIALSAILLVASVLRLAIKTRVKGRRSMLSGVVVLAVSMVHQLSTYSQLDPIGGLLVVFLPQLIIVLGIFLFVFGFARMVWAIPSTSARASAG